MAEEITEPQGVVEELLPVDDEPLTPEEDALAVDDEEVFDAEPLEVEEIDAPRTGRSWAFDFVSDRFFPSPSGGPQPTRGMTTLRFWVEKCLRTERGAFPIYAEDYGMEGVYDLVGEPITSPLIADYQERVREALTFHPRITDVVDFSAVTDLDEEAVAFSFTVVTDEGDTLAFTDLALT